MSRISGPLRDRIDIWVWMPPSRRPRCVARSRSRRPVVAARIAAARAEQRPAEPGRLNARVGWRRDAGGCRLGRPSVVERSPSPTSERLSGRGTDRLLRVARTIADLAATERVLVPHHVEEAARWRSPLAATRPSRWRSDDARDRNGPSARGASPRTGPCIDGGRRGAPRRPVAWPSLRRSKGSGPATLERLLARSEQRGGPRGGRPDRDGASALGSATATGRRGPVPRSTLADAHGARRRRPAA